MTSVWRRLSIGAALVAAVGTGAAVVASLADADPSPDPVALKRAEIARLRGQPVAESVDTGPRPVAAKPDSGPAAAVAQVKADFIDNTVKRLMLTKDNAMPSNPAAAVGEFMASASVASEVAAQAEGVAWSIRANYPIYPDARFSVEEWQGVQVDGNSAHAVVMAHYGFLRSGAWDEGMSQQYEADLVLEGGRWKFVTLSAIHPGE